MQDQLNRYHHGFLARVVIKTISLVSLCNLVIVFQKTKSVTKSRVHCNISRYKCGIFKKFFAPLCPSYYVAKQMMQRIGFALRMSRRESRQIGRSPLQQVFERETELMQIPFFICMRVDIGLKVGPLCRLEAYITYNLHLNPGVILP